MGDIDTLGTRSPTPSAVTGVSLYELFTPFGQDQVIREGTAGVLGGLIGAETRLRDTPSILATRRDRIVRFPRPDS